MKRINLFFFASVCIILLMISSCETPKKVTAISNAKSPYPMMIGSFSSAKQAEEDPDFFSIALHMYPIWENKDGDWLYVEQAMTSRQDKPYRVRVYKVEKVGNGQYKSVVYKLKDQSRFIGKWKETSFFNSFDESILEEREGCDVFLTNIAKDVYEGATIDKACSSTLREATYANSNVRIEKDKIIALDQGFDKDGNVVWGPTKGGYIFERIAVSDDNN